MGINVHNLLIIKYLMEFVASTMEALPGSQDAA
jgi:hypothetical protein